MSFSYLASPYTHRSTDVMERRYIDALRATHWLVSRRIWVYSPIVHCHEMARLYRMPVDHEFWTDYDHAMIDSAKDLLVLTIDGWQESRGVRGEIEYATTKGLPFKFIRPARDTYKLEEPLSPTEK